MIQNLDFPRDQSENHMIAYLKKYKKKVEGIFMATYTSNANLITSLLTQHEAISIPILFSQKKGKANDLIDAKLVGVKKIVTQAMEEEQVSKSHKISYRNFAIKYFGKTKN